nr:hypothetical protein [Tanacetum cinerariifolium]
TKSQELKQRIALGETGNVDYYSLICLRRGCSQSELERAHLLLILRHKPDKSTSFIDQCEFANELDIDSIPDKAKMSALLLYRWIQRGYSNVTNIILAEEAAANDRKKASAALQQMVHDHLEPSKIEPMIEDNKKIMPDLCSITTNIVTIYDGLPAITGWIQRGYSNVTNIILAEEATANDRKKASAALQQMVHDHLEPSKIEPMIKDNKKNYA